MTQVQESILDIFGYVHDLCEKHNIPYFSVGGTCLGAVRHHGFIPWDDDIDIAIPIQYYDNFLEIAEKELPDHLKVFRCDRVKHYKQIFVKVHNINTTFIEDDTLAYPDAHTGIWVDVMPISSIPSEKFKERLFYFRMKYYYKMNWIRRYPLADMRSVKMRIMWLLARPFRGIIRFNHYSEKWLNMLRKYPLGSTELTGCTWWHHKGEWTFPSEIFTKTVPLPFEDRQMNCPAQYERFMRLQFGDYMKIPSPDEIQIHNPVYVSFDKPVKEFSMDDIRHDNS